ncbi:MAG: ATP-binding protein [Bacteroidales bacterium]|nr:ATP-binding protein [Bacteroidales bacterium]
MTWIKRSLENQFQIIQKKGKVFSVFGARRVGKTSVIQKILKNQNGKIFIGTGDDQDLQDLFSSQKKALITSTFGGYEWIFIDEAQRIPNIGLGLKILVDDNPEVNIIASGSSSFELSGQLGEPLTGRQISYTLFPISISELAENFGRFQILQNLHNYLIFGTYPETLVAENTQEKQAYLLNLRNSYMFKDILELENIRNASKLNDLLKLIAFQIGSEVSLNELGNSLGIAKQTVERYLDLLEKAFIIINVRGYSSNLRKEVNKTSRYYFWDNGIRNAIINNFNLPETRMDMGMLWENFCVIERMKKQAYQGIFANNYFWRTYDRQEIDLVEERGGELFGYEFKWNPRKKVKAPKAFLETYSNSHFEIVNPENFMDFLV